MKDMKNMTTSKFSNKYVFDIMFEYGCFVNRDQQLIALLYVLYALHKGYDNVGIIIKNRVSVNDTLMNDLIRELRFSEGTDDCLKRIANIFSASENIFTDARYKALLSSLFYSFSESTKETEPYYHTPLEVTQLMAYFINKAGCKSVYEPFCGTASLSHELTNVKDHIRYVGQEKVRFVSLLARVYAEAVYGNDNVISQGDSITNWIDDNFDAVVSCPPMGVKLSDEQKIQLRLDSFFPCSSLEEMALTRPLYRNNAKLAISILPLSFCIGKGNQHALRKSLIDRNLIDTIVFLPQLIINSSMAKCALVVLRSDRTSNDPVNFIYSERIQNYVRPVLDVERAISTIENKGDNYQTVSCDDIKRFDYNLNPVVYCDYSGKLKDGQSIVRYKDIMSLVKGKSAVSQRMDSVVCIRNLSGNFKDILLNRNTFTKSGLSKEDERAYKLFEASDDNYLLSFASYYSQKFGLVTEKHTFGVSSGIVVYKINDTKVLPEYLCYLLCQHYLSKFNNVLYSFDLDEPVIIDSLERQKEIVRQETEQIRLRIKEEKEADIKRLGVKQNISDLEHMLGATQLRISKIISRLEKTTPNSDKYAHHIKSLKDNFEYMNRIIHFSNAQIDQDSFDKKDGNLHDFILKYIDSWKNYGGEYFDLQFEDTTDKSVRLSFDETMFTVMLDSILNNAIRHSFHKNKNFTNHNTVKCTLSLVNYLDSTCVLLSVANNGSPMDKDFSIEDYVSKGRYSSETGRSGLGGYHIHQVVKGHDGYLCLNRHGGWNVVVDILFPVKSCKNNNIAYYGNECI